MIRSRGGPFAGIKTMFKKSKRFQPVTRRSKFGRVAKGLTTRQGRRKKRPQTPGSAQVMVFSSDTMPSFFKIPVDDGDNPAAAMGGGDLRPGSRAQSRQSRRSGSDRPVLPPMRMGDIGGEYSRPLSRMSKSTARAVLEDLDSVAPHAEPRDFVPRAFLSDVQRPKTKPVFSSRTRLPRKAFGIPKRPPQRVSTASPTNLRSVKARYMDKLDKTRYRKRTSPLQRPFTGYDEVVAYNNHFRENYLRSAPRPRRAPRSEFPWGPGQKSPKYISQEEHGDIVAAMSPKEQILALHYYHGEEELRRSWTSKSPSPPRNFVSESLQVRRIRPETEGGDRPRRRGANSNVDLPRKPYYDPEKPKTPFLKLRIRRPGSPPLVEYERKEQEIKDRIRANADKYANAAAKLASAPPDKQLLRTSSIKRPEGWPGTGTGRVPYAVPPGCKSMTQGGGFGFIHRVRSADPGSFYTSEEFKKCHTGKFPQRPVTSSDIIRNEFSPENPKRSTSPTALLRPQTGLV